MKKFLSILLAALCVLLPTLALAQESTTIITTVPSEHMITIVCGEHGQAVVDGKAYSGTFAVQADRLGTLVIQAQPDPGYELSQITASDLDGVTVSGRKTTLSSVHCENTITLTFYRLPAEPSVSPTAAPTPTISPEPTGTPEPTTTLEPTTTPEPTATPAPIWGEATPDVPAIGNVLYDEFIGTGDGLRQLSIVFDGVYQPQDYELLSVKPNSEEQKNTVLVRAYSEENGEFAQRSLILSVAQMVKLAQKQQAEQLVFENGEAVAAVDLLDLLSGDVQQLIGLIATGDEAISAETLNRGGSSMQTVSLTAAELATVQAEIRIIPVMQAEVGRAYDVSVWLRWGDQALEISALLPSLRIGLHVEDEDAGQYAVGYQAENAEGFSSLHSSLAQIPEEMPEHQPDEAEKFIVTLPEETGDSPATVYAAGAPLSQERHHVVIADYAGQGCYWRLSAE